MFMNAFEISQFNREQAAQAAVTHCRIASVTFKASGRRWELPRSLRKPQTDWRCSLTMGATRVNDGPVKLHAIDHEILAAIAPAEWLRQRQRA